MMSSTDDDPSTVNGRLRPRKLSAPGTPRARSSRKSDPKHTEEKPKKPGTPSKKAPEKSDDSKLNPTAKKTPEKTEEAKPNAPSNLKVLCPYCDKRFASKKSVSKHVGRIHLNPSKQEFFQCLYCKQTELDSINIIRHMIDSHPNQYFACLDCHTRLSSTSELAIHKLNVCDKPKHLSAKPYRSKLRQKVKSAQKRQKSLDSNDEFHVDDKRFPVAPGFNGIVISCELKPSQAQDPGDIEDNITTNLILPPNKNIVNGEVLEKNAVIVLDDIQWNKRIPSNFSFHNSDTDQILSRLGVVHRSPRTSEHTRRDWYKQIEDSTKFERCFDTTFYSKVAGNVQENLTKFLEGSFNKFHIDPENIIKTRKPKNNINTAEGFPILLASEQYSRNLFESYMPRAIAPRHKWKWDSVESDRCLLNPDQIKRDSHVNNCIITLVSSLDIWTQLRMRLKFEAKFNNTSYNEKKTEKQSIISNELKEILESRVIPKQPTQVVKLNCPKIMPEKDRSDFPFSLGLMPATPKYEVAPAVLSGEWTRPRCYVCCACGARANDSRALNLHIATQHPMAQVSHYEVVGECLLNADILKHLYVPPSQPVNKTRPIRGIRNECTKCKKPVGQDELHQHMLECAGDTPVVRRKVRSRPFGVRRRRPRLPDNTIRKKIRKRMRTRQARQKVHMRPRPRIRTEVGDAETIRKMLADLPAKRHRVVVNPNQNMRPLRRREQTRNKIMVKRRHSDDPNKTRKLRVVKDTPTSSKSEVPANDAGNSSKDKKNTASKPKARVANKVMRQTEALRRKTLMRQAKRKAHAIIKQTANNESAEEKRTSTVSSSAVQTDDISLDNSSSDRINVNKGTAKTRSHAARDNSNHEDRCKPAGNDQDRSQNTAPPTTNVPLKHSIASLTANTETHDKSVQFQPHFLVQQECYKNVERYRSPGQATLFENETAANKVDKPPLEGPSQKFDPYALQKSKDKQKRKGLNACIAMLKNKQKVVEPKNEEVEASGHRSVQCDTADMPQYEDPPMPPVPAPEQIDVNTETAYTGQESAATPAAPYSPAPAHIADYLPLDLSGKPPSHKATDYSSQTLDLSNKNREIEPMAAALEPEVLQEEEHDAVDLCINTPDIGVTLDLSKGPKNKNEDMPQNFIVPPIQQSDAFRNHGYSSIGSSQDYTMHQIEQLDLTQRSSHRTDGPSHDYTVMHAQHQMELPSRHRYDKEVLAPEYVARPVPHVDLHKRSRYAEHILSQDLNPAQQTDLTQRQKLKELDMTQGYPSSTGHQLDLSQRPMHRNDILPHNYATMQMQQQIQQLDIPQRYKEDSPAYAQDYTTLSGQPIHLPTPYMANEHAHSHDFTVPNPSHYETNKLRMHRHREHRASMPVQDFISSSAEQPTFDVTKTQRSDDITHFQQFDAQPLTSQLDLSQRPRSKDVQPLDSRDTLHKPRDEVLPQEYHDLSNKKRHRSIPPQEHFIKPVEMDIHNKTNYIEEIGVAVIPIQHVDATTKLKNKHNLSPKDCPAQPIELVQKVEPIAAVENTQTMINIDVIDPVSVMENVPPVKEMKTVQAMESIPQINPVPVGPKPLTKPVEVKEAVMHMKPVQIIEPVVQTKSVPVMEPVRLNKPVQVIEPVPQTKPLLAKKSGVSNIKDIPKTNTIPKTKPGRKNVTANQTKRKPKRKKAKEKGGPQKPVENLIEQIDLSKEDTDEDIKVPLPSFIETAAKKEPEAKETIDVIDAKGIDKSQTKPVYDPTLKIPQYKIRVTEANSTSSDTPSVATSASNDLPTPSPIASLANAIREYANAMNMSTVSSIGPTHRSQTTSPPLYTEAGTSTSCLATNTAPTGSLGALIATTSTTPTSIGAELDSERSQIVVPISSVQDLEIAKKIAMLPKEIVEILGRMPNDHRNQLLNILPQYMMYNTSVKQLKLVVDISPDAISKSKMSKSEIATQTSCSVEPACPPEFLNVDTEKYLIDPVTGALTERKEKDLEPEIITTPEVVQQDKVIEIIEDELKDTKKDKENFIEPKTKKQPQEISLNLSETNNEPKFITPPAPAVPLPKSKEPNEKTTASLRAVRIKPSERRKSQLLAAKSSEQPLPVASINNSVPINLEVDNSKPLAIQQAEVSSTQHSSNRNVMVDSVVPLVTKENEAKVTTNNKERRISTGIDDRDANNGVFLQSIETVPPEVAVDTKPLTAENKRPRRTSKRKEKTAPSVVKNDQHSAETLVDVTPKKLTTDSISKEDTDQNLMKIDVPPQDLNLKVDETTPDINELAIKKTKEIHNEDDSDDDISLAVIVKQKQLIGKKMPTIVIDEITLDNELTKKKEKGRKQNISNKAADNLEKKTLDIASYQNQNPSTENVDEKTTTEIEKTDHVDNKTNIPALIPENIKTVPKRRKGRRNVAKNLNDQPTDIALTNISTISPKIKHKEDTPTKQVIQIALIPIDKKLQSETNKVEIKDASTEKLSEAYEPLISEKSFTLNLPKEDIPKNRMQLSPNADVASKKIIIVENKSTDLDEEPIISKKTKNQAKKNRRKMKYGTEVDEFEVVHDINDHNVATEETSKDGPVTQETIAKNPQKENFPIEVIVIKPVEPNKEINIDKPLVKIVKNVSDDETSKSKRIRRSKNKDSPQLQVADDMIVLQWADDMQPLRRSRRGKSMYVEHATESQEHTPAETVVENRAPFTKKQLIFSKLLLDEENAKAPVTDTAENIPDVPKTKESNMKIPEVNNANTQKECNVKIQNEAIITEVESNIKIAVKKSDASASILDQQAVIITETDIIPDENNITTGKYNTVKRKKPPQKKLSNKRQKSVDFVQNRDLLIDNEKVTVQINTSVQEKRDKKLDILPEASPQDSVTNIEVINNESDKNITNYIPNYKLKEHNKENNITEPASKEQNVNRTDKTHTDSNNFNVVKENNVEAVATLEPKEISTDVVPKKSRGRKKVNRSLEKRKITNQVTSAFQSSSPKKTKKLHDSKSDNSDVNVTVETDPKIDESKSVEDNPVTAKHNIVKTTPCYDMPKAAARTRSKSVLIKSLQIDDAYDPYDIDLEEKFLQNIEPISKKPHKPFEFITSVTSKNTPQQQINKPKKPRTVSATEISSPKDAAVTNHEQVTPDTNGTENSDTDDSTKSDIPLKNIKSNKKNKTRKDVEDAVICENPNGVGEKAKGRKRKYLIALKRKRQQEDAVAEDAPEKTEDNAKELRSEQFMESFGFFSERKPRKSNLLASKKISETFHTIASENEDLDYDSKERERTSKRRNEDRDREREKEREHERIRSPSLSVSDSESNQSISRQIPHCIARRKKGKKRARDPATYCQTCDKEFRRADNLVRHHLSLFHISRLLKKEMDVDIEPIKEEPNFLLVYKQHLERLKRITERIARKNKKLGIDAPPKIRMPTFAEIMSDVRVQAYSLAHHTRRGLSRDEALFLHCCEMLKESHTTAEIGLPPDLEPVHRLISEERGDCKSDGDVDSITAKNILESEEVRNLENDFITGLKETLNVADDASVTTLKASDECLASTSRGEISKLSAHSLQHVSTVYTQQIPVTVQMPFTLDDSTVTDSVHIVISQNPAAIESKSVTIHKKPRPAKHRAVSLDDKTQPRISSDSCTDIVPTKSKSSPKEQDPYETVDDDYIEEPVVKKSINRITEILEFDMFEDKFDKIKRKCRSQTAAQSAAAATIKPSQPTTVLEQKSHKTRKKAEKKKIKKSSKKSQSMILTKGALKGFDGIKVSIPTSDINMSAIIPDPLKKKKKSSGKKKSKRDSEFSLKYESEERRSSPVPCSSKQKDIYEFEDNDDDMFEFRPTTLKERFKTSTKESPRVEPRGGADAVRGGGDDQISGSDDGDDFVYMSDDYLCSPSADETEASVDVDSGKLAADPKRSASFKRKDVVEKNAVMGKIFKNNAVKKFSAKGKEPVKSSTANLDQLFDSLLEDEPNSSMLKDDSDPMLASSPVLARSSPPKNIDHDTLDSLLNKSPEMIRKSPDTVSTESSERPMSPPKSRGDVDSPMLSPPRMTYRELLNMPSTSRAPPPSLDDYYAMDPGAERRHRARRKCTVGKQNVLAETWSSESEVEVGGAGGEERRRRGPRKGLQHRRPKQVTFKKQEESRVQGVSAASSGESSQSAGVSVVVVGGGGGGGGSGVGGGGSGVGGAAGAEWGAPAPQHGWIVGNSHKKLVTMLAHAKGRKRDDKRSYVE